MKSRSGVLLAAVSASIVTALIVGGIAWATIPDGDAIHGCYAKRDGALRVIDSPTIECNTAKENPLTWSQTGPKGDTGDRGPSGISHAYQRVLDSAQNIGPQFRNSFPLALALPEGDYVVYGKTVVDTGASPGASPTCVLRALTDAVVTVDQAAGFDGRDTLSVEASVHIPAGVEQGVEFTCTANNDTAKAPFSRLVAIAVNAVN